ncbi:MAG: toprim domain-containing protein [Desulfobacterales bacterium]
MARSIYLDIEKIRTEVTMVHLLNHYSVQLNQLAPNHLAGSCPIHCGDNKNAFHVDLQKNLFNCFTHCGGGSIFDFVMKKEEISFYKAALKIWNTFYPPPQQTHPPQQKKNQPLNLRLNLQPHHPYLTKRNVSPQLARYFQMGFCQYGIMKNRIAIPIYDICNRIVAYCGRTINQNSSPKYLFPKNFNKSHHIFNIQHITPQMKKPVFIVEGFFDCIHIAKLGFDAVAIMGSSLSLHQLTLLKDINRFYILMLDGDEAGEKATIKISNKMAQFKLTFKTVYLTLVKEPELLDYDFLEIAARN